MWLKSNNLLYIFFFCLRSIINWFIFINLLTSSYTSFATVLSNCHAALINIFQWQENSQSFGSSQLYPRIHNTKSQNLPHLNPDFFALHLALKLLQNLFLSKVIMMFDRKHQTKISLMLVVVVIIEIAVVLIITTLLIDV